MYIYINIMLIIKHMKKRLIVIKVPGGTVVVTHLFVKKIVIKKT